MELYDNVERLAKQRGLSFQEISKRANMGENSIYKWKTQTPSLKAVEKVANVLNVTVSELLGGETTKKDLIDLHDVLNSGRHMQYSGKELTKEEQERVRIILEQLFWETRNGE